MHRCEYCGSALQDSRECLAYRDDKPGYRKMRQQARDRAYDAGYAAGRAAYAEGDSMPPFAPPGVHDLEWNDGARDGFKPVTVSDPPQSDATRAASLEEH